MSWDSALPSLHSFGEGRFVISFLATVVSRRLVAREREGGTKVDVSLWGRHFLVNHMVVSGRVFGANKPSRKVAPVVSGR